MAQAAVVVAAPPLEQRKIIRMVDTRSKHYLDGKGGIEVHVDMIADIVEIAYFKDIDQLCSIYVPAPLLDELICSLAEAQEEIVRRFGGDLRTGDRYRSNKVA